MKTVNGRNIEDMPKTLEPLKREFQKLLNIYLAHNKIVTKKGKMEWDTDETEITTESYALFWELMQEHYAYLNQKESEIVEKLMERMEREKTKEIYLPKYGFKIVYDDEAKWFFKKELTNKDWEKLDKKDNEEFLKKKNKS